MALTPSPLSPFMVPSLSFIRNLKTRHKILLGYGLTLGFTGLGVATGIFLSMVLSSGNVSLRQGALDQYKTTHRLFNELSSVEIHRSQLVSIIDDPQLLQEQYGHLQESIANFESHWSYYQDNLGNSLIDPGKDSKAEQEAIQTFVDTYKDLPDRYFQRLKQLESQFDLPNVQPDRQDDLQQALTQFSKSDLAKQLEVFLDDLELQSDRAYANYLVTEGRYNRVQLVVQGVLLLGLGISAIVALILARYTSRILAEPIETVTAYVQEALTTSNFQLQVPIHSQDELGALVNSFNDLLQQVATHTQELEVAQQTLEDRVADRTQELQKRVQELNHAQAQLVQAEKMSSLGQLVAGVAHEINNPVNFIHGNLTYVKEYSGGLLKLVDLYQTQGSKTSPEIDALIEDIDLDFLESDLPKILQSMEVGTKRICEIVLSLRNFSRLDEANYKAVNLHDGIDSTLLILQHRIKAKVDVPGIVIVKDYGELPLVDCYPGQLNQVFMNILSNSIDALESRDGDRSLQDIKANPSTITIRSERLNDHSVLLSFADNGSGIPPEVQTHIFEPFFTTKPIGKGTGLGLSISYQVVTEKHKGILSCSSAPGMGTEFRIQLPIHAPATSPPSLLITT
ncbi:ATP-binding protein [Prochlorothrix hollandica]|uniref:ATP-binding protein n=1 Tax=Prochlorothrix hollandica TaxID=1223 RepID=UPI00334127E3